jgi:hypothetical protein
MVGHTHLLVGFGVGGEPLLRLIGELSAAGSTRASRQLHYVTDATQPTATTEAARAADAGLVRIHPDTPALLADLRGVLERSVMGTRL